MSLNDNSGIATLDPKYYITCIGLNIFWVGTAQTPRIAAQKAIVNKDGLEDNLKLMVYVSESGNKIGEAAEWRFSIKSLLENK